jgi:hypothetical protein
MDRDSLIRSDSKVVTLAHKVICSSASTIRTTDAVKMTRKIFLNYSAVTKLLLDAWPDLMQCVARHILPLVAVKPSAMVDLCDTNIISQNNALRFAKVVNKPWEKLLQCSRLRDTTPVPKRVMTEECRNALTELAKFLFKYRITENGEKCEIHLESVLKHIIAARPEKFLSEEEDGEKVVRLIWSNDATPQKHRGFTAAGIRPYKDQQLKNCLVLLFFEGADNKDNSYRHMRNQTDDVVKLQKEGIWVDGKHYRVLINVVADLKALAVMHGGNSCSVNECIWCHMRNATRHLYHTACSYCSTEKSCTHRDIVNIDMLASKVAPSYCGAFNTPHSTPTKRQKFPDDFKTASAVDMVAYIAAIQKFEERNRNNQEPSDIKITTGNKEANRKELHK